MTDKEAMKLALEALEGFYEYGYDRQECFEHITAIKEALAGHAMRETQRLGQEIEQEPVVYVKPDLSTLNHSRDCRFHDNETYCTCYAEAEHELEFWRSRAITYLPQRTEPIQSLQCFHCQVTIETLNDKVMHLMAERKPLTDEQIYEMYNEPRSDAEMLEFARAIEAAHGIKE
jgi:hypothetical protein